MFIYVGIYATLGLVLEEEIQVCIWRRPSCGLCRDAILDDHGLMAIVERILKTARGSEIKLCALPLLEVTCPGVDVIRGDPRASIVLNAKGMPSTEKVFYPVIIPGRLLYVLELLSNGCLLKSLLLEGGLVCL